MKQTTKNSEIFLSFSSIFSAAQEEHDSGALKMGYQAEMLECSSRSLPASDDPSRCNDSQGSIQM